jgi:hypothetical protein
MISLGVLSGSGGNILYPNPVAINTAYQSSNTGWTLGWIAPNSNGAPIDYYQIQISYDASNYSNIATTTGLAYGASGYDNASVTYWFRVLAVNIYGTSDYYANPVAITLESYGPGYWD